MSPRHATDESSGWYAWPEDIPVSRIERRVRCEDCAQHIPNPHNPAAGVGRCKLGLIGQYPAALHFCRDFVATASTPNAAPEEQP